MNNHIKGQDTNIKQSTKYDSACKPPDHSKINVLQLEQAQSS